jgi:hypothetical protein
MSNRWIFVLFLGLAALLFAPPASHAAPTTVDSIVVVPNPYNVSGRTFAKTGEAGYERLRFANLPTPCTIWIYTSAGNLVDKLVQGNPNCRWQSSQMLWNGRNSDNQYIVSDVYIYIVEHETFGRKIGKFIVIR